VAAKSIAAIPAESIPLLGVAVLIAETGYELYAACETVKDLDELYLDLGMADETSVESGGKRVVDINIHRWQKHCRGLFQLPMAA